MSRPPFRHSGAAPNRNMGAAAERGFKVAAPAKTHVIELANSAFIRPRYVRRIQDSGGFVITTKCANARRFTPTEAAKALRTIQAAIEGGGFAPSVVPSAAIDGGQS